MRVAREVIWVRGVGRPPRLYLAPRLLSRGARGAAWLLGLLAGCTLAALAPWTPGPLRLALAVFSLLLAVDTVEELRGSLFRERGARRYRRRA